jgi:hypothetical protein
MESNIGVAIAIFAAIMGGVVAVFANKKKKGQNSGDDKNAFKLPILIAILVAGFLTFLTIFLVSSSGS